MKKRIPAWVFGMVIILAPTLTFVVLALAGVKMSREHRFKSVTAMDRAHVVTAGDLGQTADPVREYLRKTEEENGSLRLTYRYPDELMPGDPVSVECLVVRTLDSVAAKHALDLVEFEVRRSLDRPSTGSGDALAWGDESRAGLLRKEGRPVGTFFAARKDRFVFVLRVTGLQLEPAELERVMRPKLEQLTRFGEAP